MTGGIRHIDARQLKAQLHDGGEIALLDAREEGVFGRRHLLMASCVPLSRLELLIDDLVPRRSARIVWCDDGDGSALRAAERIGALGYRDVSLLEGGIYVLDVRTPEEYEAGHLAGARPAPGGQLVQETDAHIATWGARIVLVGDNGVRATMTASWLKQMGWGEVAVLAAGPGDGDWVTGPHVPRVLGLDDIAVTAIAPAALRDRLAAGKAVVLDLDTSRRYARGHIPGAWFAIRSRLAEALPQLPKAEAIVLTSPDGALARLAAAELAAIAPVPAMALSGGTQAWVAAGFPSESGASHMAGETDDVVLSARERNQDREAAMREYLAWEINLVNDMASDDDQRFRVATG
jgi:rhodanese-related sulfurtransferase